MRFYSPAVRSHEWFLTLFFRETGRPNVVRIGKNKLLFGKGPEAYGQLSHCQIQVTDEDHSIEVFPGARLLGMVCSPEPGMDGRYLQSLSPADEVELVNPNELAVLEGADARDLGERLKDEKLWLDKQLRDKRGRKRFII